MEPLEVLGNSVPKFAHSKWSMNLAGPPVAKFERYNAYEGMKEWN